MPTCDLNQFDPLDPISFSIENEVGISFNCVSNTLKLVLFSLHLFFGFLIFNFSLLGIFKEARYGSEGLKWNANTRRFLCCGFNGMVHVMLFAVFITGTFDRGKYALFPYSYLLLFIPGTASVREWFVAADMIKKKGKITTEAKRSTINVIFYATLVFQIAGYFLFWMILPMIFFDNPWVLNWVYIIGYVHTSLCCSSIGLYAVKVGDTLLKEIKPAMETGISDKKITEFVDALQAFMPKAKMACVLMCPMLLLIIWVPLTQTVDAPGLDYFFYFEFFVSVPGRYLIMVAIMRVAWRDAESIRNRDSSSGGSGSENSERKKSKDFSFTAEELNPKGSTLDMQQIETR